MKKLVLLFLALAVISCSVDGVAPNEENQSYLETDNLESISVPDENNTAKSPELQQRLVFPVDCGVDYELKPIGFDTQWDVFDNPVGYLDYHLEKQFQSNWRFNLRMIKRGEPINVGFGEVIYSDFPSGFDPITGNSTYTYLSDPVSGANATLIMQDLACKMQEYVDDNYPGYYIYDVNVFGNALLCGSTCITRFVSVNFKIGY